MKLKSRRVVRAYVDRPRKMMPVPPSAVATNCGPWGSLRYMDRMGPSAKPSKPVMANTTPRPLAELAVRGSTSHMSAKAIPTETR